MKLYPELEMLFINNSMKLRELKVKAEIEMTDLKVLESRMKALPEAFTF